MRSFQRWWGTVFTLAIIHAAFAAHSGGLPLVVSLTSGRFQGAASTANVTEQWLGIPFAQPPTGLRRFKPPVAITFPSNTIRNATKFGNVCPQLPSAKTVGAPMSEDCLVLNVWRPVQTKSTARLPVLVWFYGGGYNSGASSDPSFNPTRIIQRSVAISKPIIFVAVNYRINTFGFLASSFIAPGDLNVGLQDQRLALRFVQQNIENFGGDPTKVTIWGQSAGAGSAEAHVLFPSTQKLFRAVISDSSTGPFKSAPFPAQYDLEGKPFAKLVKETGCSLGPASVSCLQKVPFDTLLRISNEMLNSTLNNQLWEPTVAVGSIVPERPSARIASGNFLHVPYLAGTTLNEGTTFSKSVFNLSHPGISEEQAFDDFIGDLTLDNRTLSSDVLDEIHKLYPANDPTAGGPFNTGDSLFDRAESWYTDNMFLAPRRLFFNRAAASQPLFGFFFTEFIQGNDPINGVFHSSELSLIFGPVPNAAELDFANFLTDSFISFVNDLNPGDRWPRFTTSNKRILQLKRGNITAIPDTFNLEKTDFLNSAKVLNEFEK